MLEHIFVKRNNMATKADFNQIPTISDLKIFEQNILKGIKEIFNNKEQKEFYSPKEFCHLTGQKYSTVLNKCKRGLIKGRQDAPNCTWQIHSSALDKYKKEATDIESE